MRLRKNIIQCLIIILLLIGTSCQQNTQKELISLSSYNSLVSLNDLAVEVSELLNYIEQKDYIKAEEVILTIHETWDSLYPYAYISGLSEETTFSFTEDLNQISAIIIDKSDEQKIRETQIKSQKARIYLDSILNDKNILGLQQGEAKEEKSQKSTEETSDEKKSDKNDLEMMQKNELSYQNSSLLNKDDFPQLNDIILPEEITINSYPELMFDEDDANAYIKAVQLTKHLSDFYYVISEAKEAGLIYIQYLLQDISANAFVDNWVRIEEDINSLSTLWNDTRLIVGEDTNELVIKLDQNIKEITQLANAKNQEMINIKCKIAIKNVEALINK